MKTNTNIPAKPLPIEQTALRGLVRAGLAFALAGPGAALAAGSFAGAVSAPRWADAMEPVGFTLAGLAMVALALVVSLPSTPHDAWTRVSACCWALSLVGLIALSLRSIGTPTTVAITVLGGLGLAGAGRWLADELN